MILKVFVIQNVTHDNSILRVYLTRTSAVDFCKRYIKHHPDEKLVCSIWHWGKLIGGFNATKKTIGQIK